MGLGYSVKRLPGEPIIHMKVVVPPRLDIERMFGEIAADVMKCLGPDEAGPVYRVNDMSMYNRINIFSQVVMGLAYETKGRPGTNSDPRLIPVFVGSGKAVQLIVEALKQKQYGCWTVPHFPDMETALAQIRQWVAEGAVIYVR